MTQLQTFFQGVLDRLTQFLAAYPNIELYYTGVVRFIFPILALLILLSAIRSLLRVPHVPEVWAHLSLPNGAQVDLTHWENIVGRGKNSDIFLNYPAISRQHAALIRREDDSWSVYDLDSKGGTAVNGLPVRECARVKMGDTVTFADVPVVLLPPSDEEQAQREQERRAEKPTPPWASLILLTVFQVLTMVQLVISLGEKATVALPMAFLGLTAVMWVYFIVLRMSRCIGFEMETIGFFLSTIGLAIVASSAQSTLVKQFLALVMGLVLFLILGVFLRDLSRVQKIRWIMAGAAILLLMLSILFGAVNHGATNWISIAGISFQPSEIAKICYIFAGAATLDRLFRKRNLWMFILLTAICGGCLAVMSDFGTAAIFFVTFLVIAYLRSGDFATLGLICGAAALGISVVATLKPYVLKRFAVWGHVWENASTSGFQQTRTMSAAASGGLVGVGAGNGWLKNVPMGNSDLVFGMVCEEWGLIIAILAVLSIVTLAVFAVRACRMGRSSFYTIAACAASSLLVFQTSLNVFGSVDILPLTGVTFPFISAGGSSMMATWGLLAFLKATDTRENASFAIRRFRTARQKRYEDLRREQEETGEEENKP